MPIRNPRRAHPFIGVLRRSTSLTRLIYGVGACALAILVPLRAAESASLTDALTRLRSDDVLIADAAVEEIVACGPPAADSLLSLLTDARRDVRAGAIRGLGLLGDPRAVSPLMRALASSFDRRAPDTFEDRYLRILTIQALGRLRAMDAAPLLERAARGDAFERAHAGVALFHLGHDAGRSLVAAALADTTVALRNLTVEGLGDDVSPDARDLLLRATQDDSWVVRDTAFHALRRWREEPAVREAYTRGAADVSWFVRETVAAAASETASAP